MQASLVPNEISYTAIGEVESWGYGIKPGKEKLANLQSLLWCPSAANSIQTLILNTKEPIDVIVDYLSCLRKHTIDVMTGMFGVAFLKATPVDWVFTAPEVWIYCRSIIIPLSHLSYLIMPSLD